MNSEMYTKYARKYGDAVLNNIYNANLERPSLLSMLGSVSGKNVLDLGCGSGIYSQYLIKQGAEVTSIDVSEEMIKMVTEKLGDKVKAYTQDLSKGLPNEKSNSFEVVISPLMIHYIKDLTQLFSDINRVLKKDGYFIFSTHHPFMDFQSTISGNYFDRELLTQKWDTIGNPVSVSFYRRSLTEIFDFISGSGLVVVGLSEGKPSDKMKEISKESFEFLSKNPQFIFFKCKKTDSLFNK